MSGIADMLLAQITAVSLVLSRATRDGPSLSPGEIPSAPDDHGESQYLVFRDPAELGCFQPYHDAQSKQARLSWALVNQ